MKDIECEFCKGQVPKKYVYSYLVAKAFCSYDCLKCYLDENCESIMQVSDGERDD